jgi:transposase
MERFKLETIPYPEKIYVYQSEQDLRKSYIGLSRLLEEELKRDSKSGAGYMFINRGKRLAKLVWWDRTGWILYQKRLQVGNYRVSGIKEFRELGVREIRLFFDGV